MKSQAQASGISGFTVRLLGTPAEESGGGKVKLIEAGAYKDVDACLMVHPAPMSPSHPEVHSIATVVEGGYLANDKVEVTFTGKPAHAAAAPWEGINALDAVVAAYVNISLLRQQILPSQRVHGVIVNGGDRPNIVPMSATLDYYIRSPTKKTLQQLTAKVIKCFEAAATATGCKVEYKWYVIILCAIRSHLGDYLTHSSLRFFFLFFYGRGVSYDDLKPNMPICESFVAAMGALGRQTMLDNSAQKSTMSGGASTDMGLSMAIFFFFSDFSSILTQW